MAFRAILTMIGLALAEGQAEGQAATIELAQELLAWKQEKLPIPFEIENEKDVGYLGALPINDTFVTEFKQLSLNTGREEEGHAANVLIGRSIVKETGAPTIPPPSWRLGGVGGEEYRHLNGAVNPTSELTVMGWQLSTYLALKEELDHWNARARGGGKLVVLYSGGDVLFGGCTEDELVARYNALTAAAGGTQSIVMAAEVSPFPADLGWRYSISSSDWAEARRNATLSALSISNDWADEYATCTDGPCGPTGAKMKYQYASSGVVMGPVGDLVDMLKDLEKYTSWTNRYFTEYFLKNPDKVTVDYGGLLMLTLNNMNKTGSPPVEVVKSGGAAYLERTTSGVTGTKVCFVQGNGNGFATLKAMAEDISAYATMERLSSA